MDFGRSGELASLLTSQGLRISIGILVSSSMRDTMRVGARPLSQATFNFFSSESRLRSLNAVSTRIESRPTDEFTASYVKRFSHDAGTRMNEVAMVPSAICNRG